MIRITDRYGVQTSWISDPPLEKELVKMNIDQLLVISRQRKGFKNDLIKFILQTNKTKTK